MQKQMMLPTASLRPDPGQPRKDRDPEKQRQLNESVARHGILQPLGVRDDKTTIVWGEGRLIAALAAKLNEVPCVVLDGAMAEWQYRNLALVENVVRSDLSQFDLWRGCIELLEANPGWGMKGLAEALSYDASAMTRIMSPSKCIPPVVDAFREGKIVFGHTYAISKAEGPEAQLGMSSFCLAGATRDAAEREVRKNRAGKAPTAKLGRIRCEVPHHGTTVVVSSDRGLDLESMAQALTDLLKLVKRESDKGLDAKTFERVCRDLARKG